jgi:hypothetical protein
MSKGRLKERGDAEAQGKARSRWSGIAGILLLLITAWALRLFRLDAQSIWWDEGISLHLATSPLGEIIHDRLNNVHPPLYFILLKGWVTLVGSSAFGGRALSALASLLQVALVFNVARIAYPRSRFAELGYTAMWIAAVLVAISPLSVIYGQEIRVYAMLPLVFLAMLLATGGYVRSARIVVLVALAVIEWIALHLHYIAIFAVAYTAGWGVWRLRRQPYQPRAIQRWIVAHGLVALTSLPWYVTALLNRAAVQSEANAGTFGSEPVPLDYLLPQVWTFHLTGLANALARPHIGWIAGLAALALLTGLVVRPYPDSRQRIADPRWYRPELLLQWLLPLSSALIVWSVRSFSHPRYIIMFAIALFPLLAVLIARAYWQRPQTGQAWATWVLRGVSLILVLTVLYLSGWGLTQYFFNPGVAKPDMRSVARFLETTADPKDVIIIPATDWSLPFEYQGKTDVMMAPPANCPLDSTPLYSTRLPTAGCPSWDYSGSHPSRAFAIDYPQGTRDWQARTAFELERQGALVATYPFEEVVVREYQLNAGNSPVADCRNGSASEIKPIGKRFGPLLLRAAWVEQGVAADTAITLLLCWQLLQPAAGRYELAMRLLDVDGWTVSQVNADLVDSSGRPSDQWPVGATVSTYHVLPLAAGTPPLNYALALGVYVPVEGSAQPVDVVDEQGAPQGQQVILSDVQLSRPQFNRGDGGQSIIHNPYNLPQPRWLKTPISLSAGLQLLAHEFAPGPVSPGQSVPIFLTWQATRPGLPSLEPEVVLEQNADVEVTTRGLLLVHDYPTTKWQAGEVVRERRLLQIPLLATQGSATLSLRLGNRTELLGTMEIVATERLEELPADVQLTDATFGGLARLAGYTLPQTPLVAGEDVVITLYWQAQTSGGKDFTVFAHLLDADGRLIGQHDGPPVDGRRPISSWTAGEYIADTHVMVFRNPNYVGPAFIEVGLYDPLTGQRLKLADGSSGDAFRLPVMPVIGSSSE